MPREVHTVGDLRELLKDSDDSDSLAIFFDEGGKMGAEVVCDGSQSAAGGRATILWIRWKRPLAQKRGLLDRIMVWMHKRK